MTFSHAQNVIIISIISIIIITLLASCKTAVVQEIKKKCNTIGYAVDRLKE